LGLGLSAFLAATILPLSSELVLSALLQAGENPLTVIITATFGNLFGSTVMASGRSSCSLYPSSVRKWKSNDIRGLTNP